MIPAGGKATFSFRFRTEVVLKPGTHLASLCVHLSFTPAADQMLLVAEALCQSHISLCLSVNVFLAVSGVKSYHVKVYLLCFCTVKLLLMTRLALVNEWIII